MKISDFKGIFKKSILTIINIENKYGDYYQITLKPEAGATWHSGEFAIFKLPGRHVEGKKLRFFSIASVPEEGIIILGTRTGKEISSFKKEFISMKEGDKVSMRGPLGWFKVRDSSSPMVMIAGGVGITPIRSIMKQVEKDISRPIELIYSSSDYYLFDDELQNIALANDKITIHKTHSRDETKSTIENLVSNYKNDAYYFLSGSPSFIMAIRKQIKTTGVNGKRVIYDPLIGY